MILPYSTRFDNTGNTIIIFGNHIKVSKFLYIYIRLGISNFSGNTICGYYMTIKVFDKHICTIKTLEYIISALIKYNTISGIHRNRVKHYLQILTCCDSFISGICCNNVVFEIFNIWEAISTNRTTYNLARNRDQIIVRKIF